jgi:hypothetical protein
MLWSLWKCCFGGKILLLLLSFNYCTANIMHQPIQLKHEREKKVDKLHSLAYTKKMGALIEYKLISHMHIFEDGKCHSPGLFAAPLSLISYGKPAHNAEMRKSKNLA